MYLINLQQIIEKAKPWTKDVLKNSFEYLLFRVSEEFSNKERLISPYEFNEKNDVIAAKLLLYPYFVATSNGHSNYLFHLFGKFYTFSLGPTSKSILEIIQENDSLKYFKTDLENNFDKLQILNVTTETSWDEVRDRILNHYIVLDDGQTVSYKELTILSDSENIKPLYLAIDSGIKALKIQSNNLFFNADLDSLQFQANYSWKYRTSRREDKIEIISYDDVKDDAKPFFLAETD